MEFISKKLYEKCKNSQHYSIEIGRICCVPVAAPSHGASSGDSEGGRHYQAVDLRGAMRSRRYAAGRMRVLNFSGTVDFLKKSC